MLYWKGLINPWDIEARLGPLDLHPQATAASAKKEKMAKADRAALEQPVELGEPWKIPVPWVIG